MARLKTYYDETLKQQLVEKFGYKNKMQVPKVDKVVLNMGVGEAVNDSKKLTNAVGDMQRIAGQKPVICKARRSVANFKLREGQPIGCKVTLRKERMYEFLDRLANIALPRVRDFRGLSEKSFDGRGNFAMGIKEQLIFPEINFDEIDETRGMDIVICTTARTNEEAKALLEGFALPFRK